MEVSSGFFILLITALLQILDLPMTSSSSSFSDATNHYARFLHEPSDDSIIEEVMTPLDHLCCPALVRRVEDSFAQPYGHSHRNLVMLFRTPVYSQTFTEVFCAYGKRNPRLSSNGGLEVCAGSCRQNVKGHLAVVVRGEKLYLENVEVKRGCNFSCTNPNGCNIQNQ